MSYTPDQRQTDSIIISAQGGDALALWMPGQGTVETGEQEEGEGVGDDGWDSEQIESWGSELRADMERWLDKVGE